MKTPRKKGLFRRRFPRLGSALGVLLGPLLVLACALLVLSALGDVQSSGSDEGRRILEESLHRAVVTCYAIEGVYPPNLDYIIQRYGVAADFGAFYIDYSVFADNIMPEITVIPL